MTTPTSLSLARITVATPKRRMDVALPDTMLVAELLPHLLRHAGEDLADQGESHGGWALHRATGASLEAGRSLAVQGIRDGEVLHLVPRRADWPELAYDDVVEVIASGARRAGRSWGAAATRQCGLAVSAFVLGLGLVAVLLAGPPWSTPVGAALGLATLLTIVGIVLSRAAADATAGAVAAASGLPYAFLGGALLAAGDTPATRLGASSVLLGSAVLLVFSVIGYAGVAALQRLFIAGLAISLAGLLASGLSLLGLSSPGSAAVALTVAIGLLPGYPLIARWLAKLPVPALPDRPEDILRDEPMPSRSDVFTTVARATELLTGMLLSAAVTSIATIAFLVIGHRTSAGVLLSFAGASALLLRARLFATTQQRVPLLVAGVIGLALLALGMAFTADSTGPRLLVLFALIGIGLVVLAAGMIYSRRTPSPYVGRIADITDVIAIMALIPLACAVAGFYNLIQGLFASIGG